jgi:outer membrane protein assembly factor BamB
MLSSSIMAMGGAEYVHLANIQVSSGQHVDVNTLLGYPNTQNLHCGETSTAEHVHLTILNGSGKTGTYITLQNHELCGHQVVELKNDPTNIILQGLTQTAGQPFTVPACASWPMLGYDAQHTHYNPNETVLNPTNVSGLTLDWTATTTGIIQMNSSPVAANGIAYIGDEDGTLYAFDATTGASVWTYPTGSRIESAPTVVNGVVYTGNENGNLIALNAATGGLIWGVLIPNDGTYASPTVVNGVVYIGGINGNVDAFDANTGGLLWDARLTVHFTTPTCKCDNLVAYFGSLLSVVDGQFQMEKMTGYDMQRVRNYDTELSHLH